MRAFLKYPMPIILLFFALYLPSFVFAGEKDYILFTQTSDNEVKFSRNLTKEECEFAYNRIWGLPATKQEKEDERKRQEQIRQRMDAACPGPFKNEVEKWSCRGNASGEYKGGLTLSSGDFIVKVECFRAGEIKK